ncbi:type II toxin-antitoxin system HicA family toxin [Propionivibrio sp.]|uniref:type II toxin-antitoxin system HicA family toxin n=1 Tax=Propionivibrio sp. TaxID=2212460 RepID=UPI0025ED2704|nr:type II toxin-antitoxin system HicA family toxin [Propionivibrio sp.]
MKFLKACGAEVIKNRGNGGHYLVKPNGRQTTVPVHGDTDYAPELLDDICKQLNTRLRSNKK